MSVELVLILVSLVVAALWVRHRWQRVVAENEKSPKRAVASDTSSQHSSQDRFELAMQMLEERNRRARTEVPEAISEISKSIEVQETLKSSNILDEDSATEAVRQVIRDVCEQLDREALCLVTLLFESQHITPPVEGWGRSVAKSELDRILSARNTSYDKEVNNLKERHPELSYLLRRTSA
jgi:hypothetical protein